MRTRIFARRMTGFLLALVVGTLASEGHRSQAASIPLANSYISFTLNAQPGLGRIAYDGVANPLVGSDLGVLALTGISTPQSSGEMTKVNGGLLNFTTGPFLRSGHDGREWEFGPGGSVTILGGVPALGLPDGSILLAGTFDGNVLVNGVGDRGLKVQAGAFFNSVNPVLAASLGLPSDGTPYYGGLSTLFAAEGDAPGAFSSSGYTSGNLTTAPVPEPGALLVFAAFAVGGLAFRRRR